MSSPITSGSFSKLMRPGLHAIFGLVYDRYPEEWRPLFEFNTSSMAYEEEVMLNSMGLVQEISEGAGISYDSMDQFFTTRVTHKTFGLGFIVTRNEVDDNLYLKVGDMRAAGLAVAHSVSKNIHGADIFNYAFDPTHPIGDGKAFITADHPTKTGTQSNILSVGTDLCELALEQLLGQIYDARDTANKRMALREDCLLIHFDNEFEATRILKNQNRPDTANRDINAMYNLGKFPGGIVINHFLEDPDAWFVKTNCINGAKYFERRALEFANDNDFETMNYKFRATQRYTFGVFDWKSYYGTPGG